MFADECGDEDTVCADGNGCFKDGELCDGLVQCNDASDEQGCTCIGYLSTEKRCDGYPDCPEGEDEKGS